MKVSIVGLGWYGTPLALELIKQGVDVKGSTRELNKKSELKAKGVELHELRFPTLPREELLDCDMLILNIPPFENQLEWFKKWSFSKKTWLIFISSTSGNQLLIDTEDWIKKNFHEWTVLRFAGLLGADRHPGKYLSGKKDLKGRLWPVNLLHQDDAVGFTLSILEKKIKGECIEVLSDEHHTREEFYTEFARRNLLPLPHFDTQDTSEKPALNNQRAKEIYSFKWVTMIGKSL
jgi:nucleoside-diphosphate-sugar epimerase